MKKALIVIDVQKYCLTDETKVVVKRIREFFRTNSSQYAMIFFTVFRNDANSPLWRISGWKDCTGSPNTDVCDEVQEFINDKNLFYKHTLSAAKTQGIHKGLWNITFPKFISVVSIPIVAF